MRYLNLSRGKIAAVSLMVLQLLISAVPYTAYAGEALETASANAKESEMIQNIEDPISNNESEDSVTNGTRNVEEVIKDTKIVSDTVITDIDSSETEVILEDVATGNTQEDNSDDQKEESEEGEESNNDEVVENTPVVNETSNSSDSNDSEEAPAMEVQNFATIDCEDTEVCVSFDFEDISPDMGYGHYAAFQGFFGITGTFSEGDFVKVGNTNDVDFKHGSGNYVSSLGLMCEGLQMSITATEGDAFYITVMRDPAGDFTYDDYCDMDVINGLDFIDFPTDSDYWMNAITLENAVIDSVTDLPGYHFLVEFTPNTEEEVCEAEMMAQISFPNTYKAYLGDGTELFSGDWFPMTEDGEFFSELPDPSVSESIIKVYRMDGEIWIKINPLDFPLIGDDVVNSVVLDNGDILSSSNYSGGTIIVEVEYDPNCDEDPKVEIQATKIVCSSEEFLPNWGTTTDNTFGITADTADDFLEDVNGGTSLSSAGYVENCWEEDWDFQWGYADVLNPGDNTGEASEVDGWNTFTVNHLEDSVVSIPLEVDENGVVITSQLKLREVMEDGYIPFTFSEDDGDASDDDNNVSAEFYCHTDVFHYDNFDFINGVEEDGTYNCVAFNVEVETVNECPAGNLIENGSFEEPVLETNWNVFNSDATGWETEWVNTYDGQPDEGLLEIQQIESAQEGSQYAELDSDWTGPGGTSGEKAGVKISQTIETIVGQEYTIKFYVKSRPGTLPYNNVMELGIAHSNGPVGGYMIYAEDGPWQEYVQTFTAQSNETTISFAYAGTENSLGMFLDNVSVECGEIVVDVCEAGQEPTIEINSDYLEFTESESMTYTLNQVLALLDYEAHDSEENLMSTDNITLQNMSEVYAQFGTPGTYTLFVQVEDGDCVTVGEIVIEITPDVCTENCGGGGSSCSAHEKYDFEFLGSDTIYLDENNNMTDQEIFEAFGLVVKDAEGDIVQYEHNISGFYNEEGNYEIDFEIIDPEHDDCDTEAEGTIIVNSGSNGGGGGGDDDGEVLGANTFACELLIEDYIRLGWDNDFHEVRKLQVFLNDYMDADLMVDGIYGEKTFEAVKAFQLQEAEFVLDPWGIERPTGYVYQTTQIRINNIHCAELDLQIPDLHCPDIGHVYVNGQYVGPHPNPHDTGDVIDY